jgi:hypothetical protein
MSLPYEKAMHPEVRFATLIDPRKKIIIKKRGNNRLNGQKNCELSSCTNLKQRSRESSGVSDQLTYQYKNSDEWLKKNVKKKSEKILEMQGGLAALTQGALQLESSLKSQRKKPKNKLSGEKG